MPQSCPRRWRVVLPLPLLLLAISAWADTPAKYVRPIEKTVPAAGVTQVVVQNLVGPITITTKAGDAVDVVVLVHAAGHDLTFARALSQQLNFNIQNVNGQLQVIGQYPLEHFRDYGYPDMKSIIGIHGTDSNIYQGKKVFIRSAGSSKAVVLWAEVRITVPPQIEVVVRNVYGDVSLRGGVPQAGGGSFDGFTSAGDIDVYRPEWSSLKLQTDYGKVKFTDGLGAAKTVHIKTNVGSTYLALEPGADPEIVAHKDLGFLHNDVTADSFHKNSQGDSVLKLGDGKGAVVDVDMSVGSLHLTRVGAGSGS